MLLALYLYCDCGSQSSIYCPPRTCKAYPIAIAILLHDHCAVYARPHTDPSMFIYAIHRTHTVLVLVLAMAISCKGQPGWPHVGRLLHILGCRVGEQNCTDGPYLWFLSQGWSRASSRARLQSLGRCRQCHCSMLVQICHMLYVVIYLNIALFSETRLNPNPPTRVAIALSPLVLWWDNLKKKLSLNLAFTRYCFTLRPLGPNQSSLHCPLPPTCIARVIAILLHVYCAIYEAPLTPLLYAIHNTILI